MGHLNRGEFFGATRRRQSSGGALLTDLHHATARRFPRHSHEAAYFGLLIEGRYRERAGRRELEYAPPSIGFHPVGLCHLDEVGTGGGRTFTIELDPRWEQLTRLPRDPDLCGGPILWRALELYRGFQAGDLTGLAAESLIAEMLGSMAPTRKEGRQPAWLKRVTESVRSRCRTGEVMPSLVELALDAGVHPVHVARTFRQFNGISLGEYQQRTRVHAAVQLLKKAEHRLADIAAQCGFSDQAHFTRTVRRITGHTPGELRHWLIR
ncbi:MAG: helix-turn-helix transcriptional regulator [Acidobacteria bacterium]|nr:helix-turn-helix transcriptional regulator [Acidobacteriota bacterium]